MAATRRGLNVSISQTNGFCIEKRVGFGFGALVGFKVGVNGGLNLKPYVGLYNNIIPCTESTLRSTLDGNWSAEVAVNPNDAMGIGITGKGIVSGKRKAVDDIAAEVSYKRFKDEPKVLVKGGYNVNTGYYANTDLSYETSILSEVTATGEEHAEEALPDLDSGSPGTVIVTSDLVTPGRSLQ